MLCKGFQGFLSKATSLACSTNKRAKKVSVVEEKRGKQLQELQQEMDCLKFNVTEINQQDHVFIIN